MNLDAVRPPAWLRWLAVAAVAGTIFVGSVLDPPSSGVPSLGPLGAFGLDKWLHAVAYAGLAGTLAVALAPGRAPAAATALAVALAVGYGVGMEVVQAPLAERSFSVGDVVANVLGAGLGALGWRLLVGLVSRSASRRRADREV